VIVFVFGVMFLFESSIVGLLCCFAPFILIGIALVEIVLICFVVLSKNLRAIG